MSNETLIGVAICAAPLIISLACCGVAGVVVALAYYGALFLLLNAFGGPFDFMALAGGFLLITAVWVGVCWVCFMAREGSL